MKEVIKEIDKKIKDRQLLLKEAMYIDDLLYSKFDEGQWYKLFNIYTMDVFEVQVANIQSAVGDQIDSITLTYRPRFIFEVQGAGDGWQMKYLEIILAESKNYQNLIICFVQYQEKLNLK